MGEFLPGILGSLLLQVFKKRTDLKGGKFGKLFWGETWNYFFWKKIGFPGFVLADFYFLPWQLTIKPLFGQYVLLFSNQLRLI